MSASSASVWLQPLASLVLPASSRLTPSADLPAEWLSLSLPRRPVLQVTVVGLPAVSSVAVTSRVCVVCAWRCARLVQPASLQRRENLRRSHLVQILGLNYAKVHLCLKYSVQDTLLRLGTCCIDFLTTLFHPRISSGGGRIDTCNKTSHDHKSHLYPALSVWGHLRKLKLPWPIQHRLI